VARPALARPGRHPFDREILRLALPALGSLAVEPLYVLTDTAVVGHLGTAQLGGLAVAGTILTTGFWVFNFLAYGTTAAAARHVGAGDLRRAAERGVEAVWLAVALGTLLTLVGLAAAGPVVDLLSPSATVRPHAVQYLRISVFGAPAILVALAATGYLRGLQDTTRALAVGLGANALNLVLELVAIYGLGLGLAASAWSTVIAQWVAAAVYLGGLRGTVGAAGATWRPTAAGLRLFAGFGVTLAVRTGAILGAFTIATAVAARIGDATVAGHQIAFQLWTFLGFSLDALAIAGQAMTGRLLGAGRPADARAAGRRLLAWGVAGGFAAGLLLVAARPWVLPVFSDDADVIGVARQATWVVAAVQPVCSIAFVLDGVLLGAGDVRFLAAAMVTAAAAFVPLALAVERSGRGVVALWLAIAAFMVLRTIANCWRFAGDRWSRAPAA
jgi:putative MATE family efflux protein